MNFEEGKLYKCSNSHLLIYPNAELVAALRTGTGNGTGDSYDASYWSEELNCTVRCSKPNEIFMFIEGKIIKEVKCSNVLFGDKQGWIINKYWLRFKRINNGS